VSDIWLFFDIGDTLVNEDRLRFQIFKSLQKAVSVEVGHEFPFRELLALRETRLLGGEFGVHYGIARELLSPAGYHDWVEGVATFVRNAGQSELRPIPGSVDILRKLSRYSLGIIADQPAHLLSQFPAWGFEGFFSVVALDSLTGFHKPDPRLFEWALNRANCSAANAVMVGNRLDADVIPAKRAGMRAILCEIELSTKGWYPPGGDELLYLQSLTRVPNWSNNTAGLSADERPDGVVTRLSELPAVVEEILAE